MTVQSLNNPIRLIKENMLRKCRYFVEVKGLERLQSGHTFMSEWVQSVELYWVLSMSRKKWKWILFYRILSITSPEIISNFILFPTVLKGSWISTPGSRLCIFISYSYFYLTKQLFFFILLNDNKINKVKNDDKYTTHINPVDITK